MSRRSATMWNAAGALLIAAVLAGCAPRPQAGPDAGPPATLEAATDTVRGVVRIVGSEPSTRIVLEMWDGPRIPLTGERSGLMQVPALEVVARGAVLPDGSFQVRAFIVRAAEGIPALDGTLLRENGRFLLQTESGHRHAIAFLPRALEDQVGRRVWLAGPLDRAPELYGVIR